MTSSIVNDLHELCSRCKHMHIVAMPQIIEGLSISCWNKFEKYLRKSIRHLHIHNQMP